MPTPDITGGFDPLETPSSKAAAESAQKLLHRAFAGRSGQALKNFLNGTWIGEPLHVVLTDVPVGAWTAALLCDGVEALGGRTDFGPAADAAVAIGIVGALAAAVTGATDWQDADAPARRLGMLHGLLNLSATTLFAASLLLRRRGARNTGRLLSTIAYAGVAFSARLGGQMVYAHRVGVDRTAGQTFPPEFTDVLADSELAEAKPTRVEHDGVPIVLVRSGARIFALAETCSHFSGPLSEGTLVGESIVCPWHRSRFALEDGRVLDGPAVHAQPCLESRVRDGRIQVRKAP